MFTLGIISLITTLASTAYGAYNAKAQGDQQEANMAHNAMLQEQQAQEEAELRAIESQEERKQALNRRRDMEGRVAKAGLMLDGTPEGMLVEQAETDEFNILQRNRSSRITQKNFRTQAEMDRITGASAGRAGTMNAFSSVLSGVGQAGSQAYSMSKWDSKRPSTNTNEELMGVLKSSLDYKPKASTSGFTSNAFFKD